jgi:ubiquinone/menaquinone biosynthesis C-methylase UbiE
MLTMTSARDRIAAQLRYYRARAFEYDATSFGARTGERRAVPGVVDNLEVRGDILELACGTGVWSVELARHATSLTAVDAAPEMIRLAERRLAGRNVTFILADVFGWTPPARYDIVFFAFWLSHVPDDLFGEFWDVVGSALKPGGRVLVIDELPERSGHETFLDGDVATRSLSDGSQHRVVKIFHEPSELTARLESLGWKATVTSIDHGWFRCEATPLPEP